MGLIGFNPNSMTPYSSVSNSPVSTGAPTATSANVTATPSAQTYTPTAPGTDYVTGSPSAFSEVRIVCSFKDLPPEEKSKAKEEAANIALSYSEAKLAKKEVDRAMKEYDKCIDKYNNGEMTKTQYDAAREFWSNTIKEARTWHTALLNKANQDAHNFEHEWSFPYTDAL